MLGVTVVTGLLGWVCLIVAGHRLGPGGYVRFSIVWGLLFGLGGAFSGLQQEVMRSTYRASVPGRAVAGQAAAVAFVVSIVGGLFVAAIKPAGLGGSASGMGLVALVLIGFASLTFVNGVLSEREQWEMVAVVLCLDAAVRTLALVLVLRDGDAGNEALVAAIGVGPFAWLVLLFLPVVRSAVAAPAADAFPRFAWRSGNAMLSAAATSCLVAGFPFLLALVHDADLDATTGSLLAGLVLVRSPLLLVVFGLRPVLMRGFLVSAHPVWDVVRMWLWCLAGAALGGVLALAVGAPVLRWVMGSGFRLAGWQLALLVLGCVGLAMLTISGISLIALDAHPWSTGGWLGALLASVVLLAVPGSTELRMQLALTIGPLCGLGVHAAGLRWLSAVVR
jgi:hypothetical protein